jgi:SAM-dependent methyltransferase
MTGNEPQQILAAPAPPMAGDAFAPPDYLWEDLLVCPACSARLKQVPNKLVCGPCRKDWPIVDGVPAFVEHFPQRYEILRESLLKVNTLIRTNHWRSVLLESDDPSVRQAAEMILNVDSANWHWLAGLNPQSRALDVGAGLGAQSHALACRFREVFALEAMPEQIDFMQQRFAQDGIRNVKILRTSPWDIPFPPESFELVVLNGVLQWLATGREGDPRELQVSAMKRAFQLLAPGGYVYIGIENRIPWRYFMGAADPHCGLPYVTVLPRPLANWYVKKRGQAEGYRNYIYSIRGYRKILAAAGFRNIQFYLAVPSYKTPRLYLPVKENIFSYYHKNFDPLRSGPLAALANRVLSGLGLLKYLQYSFAILAQREA